MNEPAPDLSAARAHLDAFFERFEEDHPDAQIEIGFGYPGNPIPCSSRFFRNTETGRQEAADFAVEITVSQETAVFFGVGLIRDDFVPQEGRRKTKRDVIGLPCLFADFDEPGDAEEATKLYRAEGFPPSHVVVTGRKPEKRVQFFWQLADLIEGSIEGEERLAGVAAKFGLDRVDIRVLTYDRVMRLAGTLSWPTGKKAKPGRVLEAVELHTTAAGREEPRSIEWADDIFGRFETRAARKGEVVEAGEGSDLLAHTPNPVGLAAQATPSAPPPPMSAPATPQDRTPAITTGEITRNAAGQVIDGRDFYARDLMLSVIRELAATSGRWPTVEEIVGHMWPQWVRNVVPRSNAETIEAALEIDGRGLRFLQDKAAWNVRQAHYGLLPKMPTIAHAAAIHASRPPAAVMTQGTGTFGAPGASGFGVAGETPAPTLALGPATSIRRAVAYRFTGGGNLPRRKWLYGRHLARRYVSTTFAPGGVGKTSLIYAESLAMASGQSLLGIRVDEPLRVYSWNGEDDIDEVMRRYEAIAQLYNLDPTAIDDRLTIESGRDQEIKIGFDGQGQTLLNEALIADLIDYFNDRQFDVVQIDPFVSSHSVNENDNNAIDAIMKAWGRIAQRCDLAVELVHHTKKVDKHHGGNTVEDGRGASAMLAAARSARVLNRMTESEADRFGIEDSDRWRYVRVDSGKASMSPPAEVAVWRELVSVDLPNGDEAEPGDSVGVVRPWTPPKAFDGVSREDAERVFARLRSDFADGIQRRASPSAHEWAGFLVGEMLGFDASTKAGKAKAKGLIKGWLETGELVARELRDPVKRHNYQCLTTGGEF